MGNATRVTVSTFGAVAALAGIEHGVGEVLQGNVAPDGVLILSWPDAEAFRVLAGEPAMTVVPNYLVTGILAIIVSLAFLAWSTLFVERAHGGPVLILLSVVWLLVGGGFGPPLLGIAVGLVATRLHTPLTWWRGRLPGGARQFLASLWPWAYGADLVAWLLLLPGMLVIPIVFDVGDSMLLVPVITISAFGLLLVTAVAGFARDLQQRASPPRATAAA